MSKHKVHITFSYDTGWIIEDFDAGRFSTGLMSPNDVECELRAWYPAGYACCSPQWLAALEREHGKGQYGPCEVS